MANLGYESTANYIDLYIENMDTNYSYDDRTCNITLLLNGVAIDSATASIPAYASSHYLTTFYGLTPSTTYTISCTIVYDGGSPTLTLTATTKEQETYSAYVYITEEGISSVDAYSYTDKTTYSCGGNPSTISGQTAAISFEAIALPGYKFSHWEYRVGSSDAPKATSSSNPFSYSNISDIYIKPYAQKAVPKSWSWWKTVASDAGVDLYADEWNAFCARINEFRVYKELPEYSFTTAVSGVTDISASICNQAWNAINEIEEHGTMPAMAVSDGDMYASFFTGLRDALNAIE